MPLIPWTRFTEYRRYLFWTLALGYVLVFFHRLSPAVVATDMMQDLQASGAFIGFLSSAYFYPYALMQLPAGLLSDSWGPRRSVVLFLAVASIGSIVLGTAPSPAVAVVGRVLVGLGVSTLFVCTLKIFSAWYGLREFVVMFGLLMAMGGVGSLFAAAPMAAVSARFSWRFSFIVIGLVTAMLTLVSWMIVRDRPEHLGFALPAEQTDQDTQSIPLFDGVVRVLRRPAFWPLALWFFCTYGIFASFAGLWGGPWLIQVYGITKSRAGFLLSWVAVGMIVGGPLVGYFSNRLFKGRKPLLILSSVFMVLLVLPLAFATDRLPFSSIALLCLGFGIFAGGAVIIGFTATKELFPVQIAGTAMGLINFFLFAGAAVLQPWLGAILESHGRVGEAFTIAGYRAAFLVLFWSSLTAFVATLLITETAPGRGG